MLGRQERDGAVVGARGVDGERAQLGLDALGGQLVLEEVEAVLGDRLQIDAFARRRRPAREVEQLLDDLGDALRLRGDDAGVLGDFGRVDRFLLELARAAADDVERRADLVGDAGGELADGGQLLRVAQARFERELGVDAVEDLLARLAQGAGHVVEAIGERRRPRRRVRRG